jgi:ABC-2 type transport system permease protein
MNWSQLRTIIWLRWRLTRNQFARAGTINAIFTIIFMIFAVVLAIGAGVGGIFAGAFGLSQVQPRVILIVWDVIVAVFLFLWFIGVVAELQRSQAIDLARLLHLPVSLRGIFVMNYIASHATPSVMIFLPGTLGLCLGLIIAKGPLMVLLVPLIVTFLIMITAWTYCIRGWLVALMVNPRRRRSILIGLGMGIALLAQGPNLYFNVYLRNANKGQAHNGHQGNALPTAFLHTQAYIPFFWLPKGAEALAEAKVLPALLGSAGAFLLAAAGLARAYTSTIRFYRGSEKAGDSAQPLLVLAQTQASGAITASSVPRSNFLERRVPFVAEDVAAFALAFFRSLTRAPEVRMALFGGVLILGALFPIVMVSRITGQTVGGTAFSFYAAGGASFAFFGLLQIMFNMFGGDRDGFRTIVLSPSRRQDVILAKNIAIAPLAFTIGCLFLGVMTAVIHLPIVLLFAGLLKLTANFLLISVAGNFTSIWVPYRVSAGSLKPTKPPAKTVFLILAAQLLFPIVAIPAFIPPLIGLVVGGIGWFPAHLVDFILSFFLVLVALAVYRFSLSDLGRMMENREKKILLTVCTEVE